MNKKTIIASLVGGVIVFLWQFMSWAVTGIHEGDQKYTEKQDTIIRFLASQNLENATYMVPRPAPGASPEDQQSFMANQSGKPWAMVSYRSSMNNDMVMPMVRGLLVDIVAVLLLCWLLGKMGSLSIIQTMTSCIAIAIIGYLTTEYTNAIWYEYNTLGHLVDALGCWALCGAWLGWWFNRQ